MDFFPPFVCSKKRKREDMIYQRHTIKHGHDFLAKLHEKKPRCTICTSKIKSLSKIDYGLSCTRCNMSVHKRCVDYLFWTCKAENATVSDSSHTAQQNIIATISPKEHSYHQNSDKKKWCNLCGLKATEKENFILTCFHCLTSVHLRCKDLFHSVCCLDYQEPLGRISIDLMKISSDSNWHKGVNLLVKSAENLPSMDLNNLADPYLQFKLLKSNGDVVKKFGKSSIIYNCREPDFNHSITLDASDFKKPDYRLVIELIDYDLTSRNDFIGCISFSAKEIFSGDFSRLSGVYKLLDENQGKLSSHKVLYVEEDIPNLNQYKTIRVKAKDKLSKTDDKVVIDLPKIMSDFEILGKGAFGVVFSAVCTTKNDPNNKSKLALKFIAKEGCQTADEIHDVRVEAYIGQKLSQNPNHLSQTNLLILCAAFQYQEWFIMIMPVMKMDLMAIIEDMMKDPVVIKYIAAQLVMALQAMRDLKIIHRDLKLENIFFDEHDVLKVGDFGISKMFGDEGELEICTSIVGTPLYLAPEIWTITNTGIPYSYEVDWWSFGVLMYYAYSGRTVIRIPNSDVGENGMSTYNIQTYGILLTRKKIDFSMIKEESTSRFLQELLMKDPKKRLSSLSKCKDLEYFSEHDCNFTESRHSTKIKNFFSVVHCGRNLTKSRSKVNKKPKISFDEASKLAKDILKPGKAGTNKLIQLSDFDWKSNAYF